MVDCLVQSLPNESTTLNGTVDARPVGLTVGGLITEVALDSTSWTPLPATPLANRNALSIQNISGVDIKIQYDNTVATYTGVEIKSGNERFYAITDSIIVYGKASAGTPTILIEELA